VKTKLIALLVVLGTLVVAFGLDDWVMLTKRTAASSFEPGVRLWLIWGSGLANLPVAGLLILLTWLVLLRTDRGKWLALALIVCGLPPAFVLALWTSLPGVVWPVDPSPVLDHPPLFAVAGAFIAALGAACLLLPTEHAYPNDTPTRAANGAPGHVA
jgi:hypothetical protein